MKSTEGIPQQQFINLVRGELNNKVSGKDNRNAKGKISQSKVARSVGVDQTTISQFKNDKYPGDNYRIAKLLNDFFRRLDEKSRLQSYEEKTIINTKAVRKVTQACHIAHVENSLVVITGDAGVGKTSGVKKYVEENTGVIHERIIPYYSAKNVINKIASEIGVGTNGSTIDVFERTLETLKGSSKLLLLDEAEFLSYRALEFVRSIYDLAEIGVALVGMPRLIENLKGEKSQYKQIYSRVSMHVQIADLRHDDPNLAETEQDREEAKKRERDIQKFVSARIPNSNGLWKEFAKYTLNPRALENLIKQSLKLAQHNNVPLDADVIEKASRAIIF